MRRLLLGVAALAAAGVALAERRPEPRRGPIVSLAPAVKRTHDGKLVRWAPREITIELDASLERLGPRVPAAVMRSFGAWLETPVALPPIRFVHGEREAPGARLDGTNSVSWGTIRAAGRQHDLAVTITHIDPTTGEILEADIVLNREHELAVLDDDDDDGFSGRSCDDAGRRDCRLGYDVESIVTHEVGHFWGLDEDRLDQRATMYFCTSRCELHKRTLEDSDHRPLERLYGSGFRVSTQGAGCGTTSKTSRSWAD